MARAIRLLFSRVLGAGALAFRVLAPAFFVVRRFAAAPAFFVVRAKTGGITRETANSNSF